MSNNKIFHVRKPYDPAKPVMVYRNLHSGLWSVRQNGIVVIHCNQIYLRDVTFRVQKGGQDRVRREGRKNVHAFVHGYICNAAEIRSESLKLNPDNPDGCLEYCPAYYNPYKVDTFVDMDNMERALLSADYCDLDIDDPQPVLAIFKKAMVNA